MESNRKILYSNGLKHERTSYQTFYVQYRYTETLVVSNFKHTTN